MVCYYYFYFRNFKELLTYFNYDIMPVGPMPSTPKQAVIVLITLWFSLFVINVFLFNIGWSELVNIAFILLIIIAFSAYFLGEKYYKNRK